MGGAVVESAVGVLGAGLREGRRSVFLFLMRLAWRCRVSGPLLVAGCVALLGRTWMFQIRVHTVGHAHLHHEHLEDYSDASETEESEPWSDTDSTNSWETIVEEVAYG